jgi:FixJ family two-component response regulator
MQRPSEPTTPTVAVIDDDASVREALCGLFASVGLATETFASAQEFMAAGDMDKPGCIVLDIRLPGISGSEFQETLSRSGNRRPIVMVSGHVDVPIAVRAMKAGAVDVLTKPVREHDLLEAVNKAIAKDAERRTEAERRSVLHERFAALTAREREVLTMVTAGLLNKQIAVEAGITEATVKLHRGNLMHKLGAKSVVDLIRMNDLLVGSDPR